MTSRTTRILILGGTTEARELAARLAARGDLAVTLSLAGRTRAPVDQGVPTRSGGFGGAAGLAAFLRAERVAVLIDATHPFAARISANAISAADAAGVPLLALRRPAWVPGPGDDWRDFECVAEAVAALGPEPRRVFAALGRQELGPIEAAPQHRYLVRSVEPVEPPLRVPHARYLLGRGPFADEDELRLLSEHRIEAILAKNSGGAASAAKLRAARLLRLPVFMIRRPPYPDAALGTISEVEARLAHVLGLAERGE